MKTVGGLLSLFLPLLLLLPSLLVNATPEQNSSSIEDLADIILSSEKTPTLSPKHVTKKLEVSPPPPSELAEAEDLPEVEEAVNQSDCSEPLNNDISCLVHIVECDDPIFELVPKGKEPPAAHDVRIAPLAKVMGANRIDKREHRLHVDVSWQMPQRENSKYLRAFKLHVAGPENKETCFVFNVTHSSQDDTVSPRYRFSSNTLFDFGRKYTVTISSLPKSSKKSPKVSTSAVMPKDPDIVLKEAKDQNDMCIGKSNMQASKWAASFRKIFLFSIARMIQVEFLAAPPQYCFEEYEVRLLDHTGILILHTAIVKRKDLKTEFIRGKAVQFGEYNFTHLDLNVLLIPSVMPVDTAEDGRCLCDTETGCSCLAADWKPVKLTRADKPVEVNQTISIEMDASKLKSDSNWHIFALMLSLFLLLMFCICVCCIMVFYRKYEKSKKPIDIRFISDNPTFSSSGTAPLIMKQKVSVLILYTHDCAQHEAAVLAFAELLRDVFSMDVHVDDWDEDDIEANRSEYINSSIVRADKVIIINSVGAYHRVVARQMREAPLERIVPGPFDNLFLNQIDLALQHIRLVSVRFSYTPSRYTLFALSPLLQFSVPDNLNLLIPSISDSPARNDHLLAGFCAELSKLQAAVSRMTNFIQNEPNWFEKSHHRVVVAPAPAPIAMPQMIPLMVLPTKVQAPAKVEIAEEIELEEWGQGSSPKTEEIESTSALPSQRSPAAVTVENIDEEAEAEADSMVGDESSQLLDKDEEDVYQYNRGSPQMMMDGKDMDDTTNLDSAYVSGSDFSAQLDGHMNSVLDKPRISDDDCHAIKKRNRDANNDSAFHDDVIGVH